MAAEIKTRIMVLNPGVFDVALLISRSVFKRLIEEVFGCANQQEAQKHYGTESPNPDQLAEYYFSSGKLQEFLNRYPPAFRVEFDPDSNGLKSLLNTKTSS